VHWNERWRGWIVARYDDVYAGLHDARMMADTVTPYFEDAAVGQRSANGSSRPTRSQQLVGIRRPAETHAASPHFQPLVHAEIGRTCGA